MGELLVTGVVASIALIAAAWSAFEARRARMRAHAAMATLVEVVGLLETMTDERRAPALAPAPAPATITAPSPLPTAHALPQRAGICDRIAALTAQGASMTEISRTLSVSRREIALGLALAGRERSAVR